MKLQDRVALVTGASRGIGRAIAQRLAGEGAAIGVNYRSGKEQADEVVQTIEGKGGKAVAIQGDVSDYEDAEKVVNETIEQLGGLHILVNNAGVALPGGATVGEREFEDAWARTIAVNLTAQARLIRAALPHLQRDGAGRVVNIASTEALIATAGIPAYTASKHGVVGLTRSFPVELGRFGVTVNCICPGPIRTGMTAVIPDEAKEKFARRRVPLRRYGDPEEVAQGTLNFVLPASSYINGAILPVDGGMMAQNT